MSCESGPISHNRTISLSLCVITDRTLARGRSHEEVVHKAIEGGAPAVQFRDKETDDSRFYNEARVLRELTAESGVTFIINDRLDIALAVGADGVHLGQEDLPAGAARRLIGERMILGISAHTAEQARKAEEDGADYVGVGPVFRTDTKVTGRAPVGTELIAEVSSLVHIPVIGVGGIDRGNASSVVKAGAMGVAVASAVVGATDIARAAREMLEAVGYRRGTAVDLAGPR